jgi:hypothetical protein
LAASFVCRHLQSPLSRRAFCLRRNESSHVEARHRPIQQWPVLSLRVASFGQSKPSIGATSAPYREKVATASLTGYKWEMFKITDPATRDLVKGCIPSLAIATAVTAALAIAIWWWVVK